MPTLSTLVRPQSWIGCLSCYNAGRLVGDWYDADVADLVTPEDLHGRPTDHEELWVFDHDNFHGALDGECSPSEAAEIARALDGLTSDESAPFSAWISELGAHVEREHWVERFREEFRGFHKSQGDFAVEWAEETGQADETSRWPYTYIDWDSAAEELFSSGYHAEPAVGGIYVFDPQ